MSLWLLAACTAADREDSTGTVPSEALEVIGTIERELGDEGSTVVFGRISGVDLTPDTSIVVVDGQLRTVTQLTLRGDVTYAFGGVGEGPLEFNDSPCCPALADDGLLWVLQRGHPGPFRAFDVAASGVSEQHTVRVDAQMSRGALSLPSTGVIEGTYLNRESGHPGRVQVGTNGYELGRYDLPPLPVDSTEAFLHPWKDEIFWTAPYATIRLYAFSRRGAAASVVTSRYAIQISAPTGETNEISRDLEGPPLSALERDTSQAHVDSVLERSFTHHPFTRTHARERWCAGLVLITGQTHRPVLSPSPTWAASASSSGRWSSFSWKTPSTANCWPTGQKRFRGARITEPIGDA